MTAPSRTPPTAQREPTGAREISVANRHSRLRIDRRGVSAVVALLDAHASRFVPRGRSCGGCPPGELSLVFLTDAALAKLHATFLADPTITDVITFAGDPTLGLAGEICLSADAAQRRLARPTAPRQSRTSAAFSTELTLYLVHGWLHLAGYDDLQPAKKREMRRAEARAMRLLGANDAIPKFAWR